MHPPQYPNPTAPQSPQQPGQMQPGYPAQGGVAPGHHHPAPQGPPMGAPPMDTGATGSPGFRSMAAKKRARRAGRDDGDGGGGGGGAGELIVDKLIDFALIFVGLYAATAVQRCQDTAKDKQEYVTLLRDFKRELNANLEQEGTIAKDLGAIEDTTPGKNLGPMQVTFKEFFEELSEDEKVVHCLHDEFLVQIAGKESKKDDGHGGDDHGGDDHGGGEHAGPPEGCHELYAKFDKAHSGDHESFNFKPAILTPFYRHEVWQLYLADGVKTFRNKDLAVKIAEVYANARLIEEQVEDIETTYNDAFMKQVGRTAATDMELAEIVHDEETQHGLSDADVKLLLHVDEAIKDEHYASLEVERILELKVERMKKTVLTMREEISAVQKAIDDELEAMKAAEDGDAEEAEEAEDAQ